MPIYSYQRRNLVSCLFLAAACHITAGLMVILRQIRLALKKYCRACGRVSIRPNTMDSKPLRNGVTGGWIWTKRPLSHTATSLAPLNRPLQLPHKSLHCGSRFYCRKPVQRQADMSTCECIHVVRMTWTMTAVTLRWHGAATQRRYCRGRWRVNICRTRTRQHAPRNFRDGPKSRRQFLTRRSCVVSEWIIVAKWVYVTPTGIVTMPPWGSLMRWVGTSVSSVIEKEKK